MKRITVKTLQNMKEAGEKIAALTCYSYQYARIMSRAEIEIFLVGDSLGMVELGYENTLPVTLEEMIHHTKAVKRSDPKALIVADMPFMSYNVTPEETLRSAGRLIKEGGADAVKLEGGKVAAGSAKLLVENGIPVMGHIGLTPQSVNKFGGYRIQGKTEEAAAELAASAKILEGSGVFAVVLEGIPALLAKEITHKLAVPTIGIGAGSECDGQILVVNDMLGMDPDFSPRYLRRYADLYSIMLRAFVSYSEDVKNLKFPSAEEEY